MLPSDRRAFLKRMGWLTAAGVGGLGAHQAACGGASAGHASGLGDPMGVLVDATACIGCRACEHACKQSNGFEAGELASYDDASVFARHRRPEPDGYTVVNAFDNPRSADGKRLHVKVNCLHCNQPACVSACIVGALNKQANGAVTYEAWKCIGCRYCMVACPFQIPAYEYDNVLTPQVRKCQFCVQRTEQGEPPACVQACPQNALVYGKRRDLLAQAHARIADKPGKYVDHIYGEHEVGGTSWLYLSPIPHEEAGFVKLGSAAPPVLTEAIQHGVFKYWIAPVGWYAFLSAAMWFTGRRRKIRQNDTDPAVTNVGDTPASGPLSLRERAPGGGVRGEPPITDTCQPGTSSSNAMDDGGRASMVTYLRSSAHPSPGLAGLGHPLPLGEREFAAPPSDAAVGVLEPPPLAESLAQGAEIPCAVTVSAAPRAAPDTHAHAHSPAAPVAAPFFTPGVWLLIALVLAGGGAWLYRFIVGLAATTNLDQQHPWGLWIAMDVGSGIALAGGGFVTAALVHIFHREHYHAVARSALLTALLGYTFYVPGLLADIGRWYNIWHPTLPNMWQGNSVLFEVGICVMLYLNVQYAELMPIVCERFIDMKRRPRLARWVQRIHDTLERIMPALLVLGVTLSTFHQSSLGNLMVIAPYKLHALWWTPVSPILFLLSAMMVGFPMVIFTILFASWSLRRKPEMDVLGPLARYVPVFLGLYLALKVADVIVRGVWPELFHGSLLGISWLVEVGLGVVVPVVMLSMGRFRRSPGWLAGACLLVILGVVLNRLNVFVLAYSPPYATKTYFPSLVEFAVSIGLVAALLLAYRAAVTWLPILHPQPKAEAHA